MPARSILQDDEGLGFVLFGFFQACSNQVRCSLERFISSLNANQDINKVTTVEVILLSSESHFMNHFKTNSYSRFHHFTMCSFYAIAAMQLRIHISALQRRIHLCLEGIEGTLSLSPLIQTSFCPQLHLFAFDFGHGADWLDYVSVSKSSPCAGSHTLPP